MNYKKLIQESISQAMVDISWERLSRLIDNGITPKEAIWAAEDIGPLIPIFKHDKDLIEEIKKGFKQKGGASLLKHL